MSDAEAWVVKCEQKLSIQCIIFTAARYTKYRLEKGNAMRSVIKKWGNSASIRIPSSIMEAAQLNVEDPVEIREEAGHIVIDPVRTGRYELSQLLSAITPENLHGEVSFGIPIGKELL